MKRFRNASKVFQTRFKSVSDTINFYFYIAVDAVATTAITSRLNDL